MAGRLAGRSAAVFGFASHRSLAWAAAQSFHDAGLTNLIIGMQTDRFKPALGKLTASWPIQPKIVICDATSDSQIASGAEQIAEATGGKLDVCVHSMAWASQAAMRAKDYSVLDCNKEDFQKALDISAFSLVSLSKALRPMMARRKRDESDAHATDSKTSSIVTMSYLGGERVIPGYKIMGPCKATLEHFTRYLASDLGPEGIRVNAISAGPIDTLASRGIPGFTEMKAEAITKAPLRRSITMEDVGNAAVFLGSKESSAITGQVLHVDCGVSIMG
jgi:enoyl-[acyl-carrier protein] reductase I